MATITITLVLDDDYQIDATAKAIADGAKGVRALVTDLYRKDKAVGAKFAQYKASIQILDALGDRYADAVAK